MFKRVCLAALGVLFLMSHNAFAVELTSNVVQKDYYHQSYISATSDNNCTSLANGHVLQNQNTDTPCNIYSLTFSVIDMNNYEAGDYLVIPLYVQNMTNNNSLDAFGRFNTFSIASTNGARADLVEAKYDSLTPGNGVINFYFRIWQGGNIYSATVGYGNGSSSIRLFPSESIAGGIVTLWHERQNADYSSSIGNISTLLSNIYALNNGWFGTIDQRVQYIVTTQNTMNGKLGNIQVDVAAIKALLQSQSSTLEDIESNTQNVSDWADEQRQAYQNMQNTDGLINVGDQDQALGFVGSINSFLGILSSTAQGDCVLPGDMGNVDLGNLNLCDAPQEVRNTIGTVGGIVLAVIDILIAYNTIKYIIAFIDWARRN